MPKKYATEEIRQDIRRLAGDPGLVGLTERARYELLQYKVLKKELCSAICQWIDEGKLPEEVVSTRTPNHAGKRAWVLQPSFHGTELRVKLQFRESKNGKRLLVISVHTPGLDINA